MRLDVKALISVLIVVLVALSSTRVLDDYVDDYTNESIRNAALTYASARGINALVSVLQSTEVEAGVIVSGSMTIGEVFDPLNDMIERFSSVMTWVLASLAAQKLLLLLASHVLFLYLVAVLGVVSLLLIYFGRSGAQSLLFRCFLVVVFVRFAG
jgi:ABC-type protease/lipase transport system fused ATPase/permease subunit